MAAGDDVELCPVCNKSVCDSDNGLQCDAFCNKWHHISCVNVNVTTYKKIINLQDNVKWICVHCTGRLASTKQHAVSDVSVEDYASLRDLVGNLLKLVQDIVSNNVEINRKLDNIIEEKLRLCTDTARAGSGSLTHELTARDSDIRQSLVSAHSTDMLNADMTIETSLNKYSDAVKAKTVGQIEDVLDCPMLVTDDWQTIKTRKKGSNLISDNTLNRQGNVSGRSKLTVAKSRPQNRRGVHSNQTHKISAINGDVQVATSISGKRFSNSRGFVVGTSDNTDTIVAGEKRAWFYVGRVKGGTNADAIKNLITSKLPGVTPTVDKLDSIGTNDSFKVSVEFDRRDELLDGSIWPKNVIIKRFLFKRVIKKPLG